MPTYRIELPRQTHRLNQLLGHWAAAARKKRDDRQLVGICCKQAGVPVAVARRRVRLTVILGPRQRRAPDKDCGREVACA